MKPRRGLIAVLLLFAASIWSWNLYLLVGSSKTPPLFEQDLPDLPDADSWQDSGTHLPDLTRDPFDSQAASRPKERNNPVAESGADKPRSTPVAPPRLTLVLIMKRSPLPEAVLKDPSGETLTLSPGGAIGDWTVGEITLDRVYLKHKSGAVHELSIR